MRVEPFEPPRLWTAPGRDALWNAFISHAGNPVSLAMRGASLRFVPSPPPAAMSWAVSLLPERAPHLIAVVHGFPFHALFGAELTTTDLPDLPVALRGALVEGMVAFVRDALPDGLAGDIKVLDFGSASELAARVEPDDLAWFRVEMEGLAAEPVSLTLGCGREALLASLLSLEPSRRTVRSGIAGRLTTPVHVTLGALLLTRNEIRTALLPGAVAVFPAAAAGELVLRSDAALYRFHRTEGGWQCRGREARADARHRPTFASSDSSKEPAMPDDAPAPLPSAPLQVCVDFDLGSLAVPLAELESWQAGAVVPLDPPVPGRGVEVTLRVNGLVIGSGDLVAIDDRPAVRIARLALES